ncbi:MAG: SurA N-terminal domain-containing protein [Reichenbachiella sp.]
MALINTLRNKGGKVVVFLIGFSIVAFVGSDLFGPNSTILGNKVNVGEIAGVTISYQDFIDKQDEMTYNFQANQGRSPSSAEQQYIRNQTWDALVDDFAYQQQFQTLGLSVSSEELVDMVQGDNISPQIRQAFTDPQTGQFSKENVVAFLQNLSTQTPQQRASWYNFEQGLGPNRMRAKYNGLIFKSNYATKAEAKYTYNNANNTAEVNYIYIPFESVTDTTVKVSDAESKAYLASHKEDFEVEESKVIKYLSFDVVPSAADSALVLEEITSIASEFAVAENDSLFAVINSEGKTPIVSYQADALPSPLQGEDVVIEVGTMAGPLIEDGNYVLYKVAMVGDSSYKVAKVALEIYVSDDTRNEVYRVAEQFVMSSTDLETFTANASENKLKVKTANKVGKNDRSLPSVTEARNIVFWAYNEAEVGDVSEVFEIDNQYVIASVASASESGTASLLSVRNEVEKGVKNEKKAIIIIEKLKTTEGDILVNKVVNYDGNVAKYYSMSDLKLSSNTLTGVVGLAPEAVGVAFSMEPGETTEPFAIDNGVLLLQLVNKYDAPEVSDYEVYRSQVSNQRQSAMYYNGIDQAVRKLAEIKDDRYKFF